MRSFRGFYENDHENDALGARGARDERGSDERGNGEGNDEKRRGERSGDERIIERIAGRAAEILLVEDDEAHAEHILRVFEEERIANRVYWVRDGAEALDFLYRRGRYAEVAEVPKPDLIMLDLRLPRVNGHEVLLEIKRDEELRVIPVVILVTSETEVDMMRDYIAYADNYIIKPLDFDKFRRMISHIGFYFLVWNRHPWQIAVTR